MSYALNPPDDFKRNFAEAEKQVKAEKQKENMMAIPFDYGHKLVVPYKDGVKIIEALANAEVLKEEYGQPAYFAGVERHHFNPTIMPREEYELIKIGALLKVDYKELKLKRN